MELHTSYSVRIWQNEACLDQTAALYRRAVDFFIGVCVKEWDVLSSLSGGSNARRNYLESITVPARSHPNPPYNFNAVKQFYKMPCYLRRSAAAEALGRVSSYQSSLSGWEQADPSSRGRKPGFPQAGFAHPALYKGNMYEQTGTYTCRIKAWVRHTWDWIEVRMRKCDVDYIKRRCADRKMGSPVLIRRGKCWHLDFPFTENVTLSDMDPMNRVIVACDLGINNACTCAVLRADGTVLGRKFLSLPRENDCLMHELGRIAGAQKRGASKTPRLWAAAKGTSRDIASKTAAFIMETAIRYHADTIVFEHLDTGGKKKGSKKQRIHHWKCREVQNIVALRAHRAGMRISHVCAWGTSRLAFDGSGPVRRGAYKVNGVETYNYSICVFKTGKTYNCDLNAAYNIGARYFIRALTKSVPETVRQGLEANVPSVLKRSSSTLSTLIRLYAVLTKNSIDGTAAPSGAGTLSLAHVVDGQSDGPKDQPLKAS